MLPIVALLVHRSETINGWTLKDGTKVSVAFVDVKDKSAWRPDGTALKFDSIPHSVANSKSNRESEPREPLPPGTTFLITYTNFPISRKDAPTYRFKMPGQAPTEAFNTVRSTNEHIWIGGLFLPEHGLLRQDIAVGIATGPWTNRGAVQFNDVDGKAVAGKNSGITLSPTVTLAPSSTDVTVVSIPESILDPVKNFAIRVTARNKSGNELTEEGSTVTTNGPLEWQFRFIGKPSEMRTIELDSRPLEWITIKAAHFKPG